MSRLIIWPSMMLLGWTVTKLWTLKYGSKSIQTSLILRQRPPKWYKLLKYFMISVILFKMSKHSDFHLISLQIDCAWQDFTVVTKLIKNFKSLYGLGRCGALMVSALDSRAIGPGSSPGRGHCVVFLGETLYSHSASLHPGPGCSKPD